MGENVKFHSFSFGSMLPLDMLAEVASNTLKTDPSLCINGNLDNEATPAIGAAKLCSPKRSASHNEKLTLDQIRNLSDKALLEMFSEHSSDEIRRVFSYKCCLIPGKCDKSISSFGNETKASLQMKMHLVSHLADLINEAKSTGNNGKIAFEAEPLHVKKKKMLETGPKKRKKVKNLTKKVKNVNQKQISEKKVPAKSKVIKNGENKIKKEIKLPNKGAFSPASMLNGLFNARFRKCAKNVAKGDKFEKENERYKALMEESFLSLPAPKSINSSEFVNKVNNKNLLNVSGKLSKKLKVESGIADVKLKQSIAEKIEQDTKWEEAPKLDLLCNGKNTIWPNSVESIFSNCVKQEPLIYPLHDHTYTSMNGKTYIEPAGEGGKIHKEGRKVSTKPSSVPLQLLISTPAFPYVYNPILPHISEIQEISLQKNRPSSKNSRSNRYISVTAKAFSLSLQGLTDANNSDCHMGDPVVIPQDLDGEMEDDENMPHTFTAPNSAEERLQECDTNDNSISKSSNEETVTKNENVFVDSSSASIRKLALKCIRQLRTKKKEERGPLICQICKNKSFTAQATLMYHYRSHAGIKPFSCTKCDATFTRQHSLNYHNLIHNNMSRFMCTDCGRNFRHPSHYKEHLRRHTGETPYQCTDCNLRFKTRNTYKRHLKTRHGKILTALGIRILSLEEFDKVRTSPRKRISKHPQLSRKNGEEEWQDITFSGVQLPSVELEMFES